MPLTTYELAKLRLQAFSAMDGWGCHNEKGIFIPHDLEKRKKLALEFVEWAVAEHKDED